MTEVTSRAEWYDEDPFPDVPPTIYVDLSVHARGWGKVAALEKIADVLKPVGIAMGNQLHGLVIAFNKFGQAVAVEPKPETVRERALRLKQQPHSMTSDRHFDHRGQRRY